MRNLFEILAGMLILATPASAQTAVSRVPKLIAAKVVVASNGARSMSVSGDETVDFCANFRLSARDVRDYFASAQQVNSQAYNHDLDMSRCHASGTVRFTNGWQGQWTIDLMRRGSLRLANGRRFFFYCVDCTSIKFDPLTDEDREIGRELIRASRILK